MANSISTNNDMKNIDIFSMPDMEVVMRGGDPSTTCYNYRDTSSVGQIGRGALSASEKSKIYDYTVLNTGTFEKNCNGLYDTAETRFKLIIDELTRYKESLNEKAFSLNGETMQDDFDEVIKAIEGYLLQISEYTEALIARGKTISEKQKVVYENTVRMMNFVYEKNKPEIKMVSNPGNLTPVK